MKTLITICFSLVMLTAQSQSNLKEFFLTSGESAAVPPFVGLDQLIQSMESGRNNEQKNLRKVFQKLHSKYLKSYVAYSGFNEMFTSGSYDCLTGTALFSYVLDKLNYQYDIIETNYHIFLIVHLVSGDVLLETTDRFGGFVTDADAIAERTGGYRKNVLTAALKDAYQYKYSFELYQVIDTHKVTGLLFFNQAVKAFNRRDWMTSSLMLQKASTYYPSLRCEELSNLLTRTLQEARIEVSSREACLGILQHVTTKGSEAYASN